MTRLLSRAEARAFVETLSSVRDAPETCLLAWSDKAHMRRNALLYDYVELDDGAVIRFARPSIEKRPPGGSLAHRPPMDRASGAGQRPRVYRLRAARLRSRRGRPRPPALSLRGGAARPARHP